MDIKWTSNDHQSIITLTSIYHQSKMESMNKHFDSLKERLTPFSNDIDSGRSFSAVVAIHYELIRALQDERYPLKLIIEASGIEQSAKALSLAMYRAKQRKEKNGVVESSPTLATPDYQVAKNPNITKVTDTSSPSKEGEIIISEELKQCWTEAFGFSLSDTFLPFAIEALMEHGWTPENYYKLKDRLNIFNSKKLTKTLSEIKKHKATNKEFNQ